MDGMGGLADGGWAAASPVDSPDSHCRAYLDGTRVCDLLARHALEERGFARAVRPDHADDCRPVPCGLVSLCSTLRAPPSPRWLYGADSTRGGAKAYAQTDQTRLD